MQTSLGRYLHQAKLTAVDLSMLVTFSIPILMSIFEAQHEIDMSQSKQSLDI